MCGIGGIWRRGGGVAEHGDLVRMMSAIRHRGPEGAAFGRMDEGRLLVGFLRLGFTAEGLCQQPLYNEDGSIGLVYNGEIYDFEALRSRLVKQGHRFRTASDSEVIIHLYEEHGEEVFEHLNGEFAFVLWDGRRQELWMVRDRFGVKPLFYAWHRGGLVFASEAKGILALPGFSAEIEPRHFTGAGIGLVETGRTPFKGIRSVRPGHVLRVGRDGERETAYFEMPFRGRGEGRRVSLEEAARELRGAVRRAVERRMAGDPPMGVSLSSGVDSTIVTGLMAEVARERGRGLLAFTVGYDGAEYDESAAAGRTAARLGIGFERVRCTPEMLAEGFLPAIGAIEVATNSLSATARIAMAKRVRGSGLKALMSGDGSDELFGGYPYFGVEALWRGMLGEGETRARAEAGYRVFVEREAASKGIFWDGGGEYRKGRGAGVSERVRDAGAAGGGASRWLFSRSFSRGWGETPPSTMRGSWMLGGFGGCSPPRERAVDRAGDAGGGGDSGAGDRVEMAGSLEGRVPYLDVEVVRPAASLPEEVCGAGDVVRKAVLRRAFADLLPKGFLRRRRRR
ncbi:MAG: asparagine synthase (glutamine-hydrolyzing) [Polyangiaceae bacterium]